MPGFLLHFGATVRCFHGGSAQPLVVSPRVLLAGQPAVTSASVYSIAGCGGPSPPGPCVTAQWATAAARVMASGQPVLLQDSQAICAPTGAGLNAVAMQTRAQGV